MKTHGPAVLLLLLLFACPVAMAQTFTPVSNPFAGAFRSTSDWGDYDGDGDLDYLLTGYRDGGDLVTFLYRNDDSQFVEVGAEFSGLELALVDWGDYDNDGDLDFIISPVETGEDERTVIYRNDGSDQFTLVDISVSGQEAGGIDFGDYDNDGDLDFVMSGSVAGTNKDSTRVFRNEGGDVFTDIEAGLLGLLWGSVEWGDYDSDGDLDILTTGTGGFWDTRTIVYRNDGGDDFEELWIGEFGLLTGQARWGDFDRDGDLDILVDGVDSTGGVNHTFVYRNDGSSIFTDINATLPAAGEASSIAWGDCDNDGDLDVAVTSSHEPDAIYRYEGDSTFTALELDITAGCCGSLAWGDYDHDGDLDLVIANMVGGDFQTRLYRNDIATANTPPSPPTALQSSVFENTVSLSWQPGSDVETGSTGLSYNLRVGTTPGGTEIVPPMSDPATGYHRIATFGNVFMNLSWELVDLPMGTYYWSVQSIDNNFEGSVFAAEQQFEIVWLDWLCGDIDGNGEGPDISDLVYLVDWMFNDGPPPPVLEAADVDGSGGDPDISDLVYLVDYMFTDGPAPVCE